MENTKEKNFNKTNHPNQANQINQSEQQNQYYNDDEDEKISTLAERKIIVYLIILAVVLLFIALFFIYDIVDRGTINAGKSAPITYPDNDIIDVIDGTGDGTGTGTVNGNGTKQIVDTDASLKIFEGTKEWSELKELNVFDRSHRHVVDGKIAPGVQDTYVYTVECYGDYKMLYNMAFSDDNPLKVNMIYKLRRNGEYVAGDENTWVTVEELTQKGMTIAPGTIDVFILDWRWKDADNDTEIGETEGAKYIINVKADAEAITN